MTASSSVEPPFPKLNLKEIITHYEHASGQAINFSKSAIAFSTNT